MSRSAAPFASDRRDVTLVWYAPGIGAAGELVVLDWAGELVQGKAPCSFRERREGSPASGGRWTVWAGSAFEESLAGWRDEALDLWFRGQIVHDPEGRAQAAWSKPRWVPPEIWEEKIRIRYREFRRRQASLAWNLRRGEPLAALDNVAQIIGHALTLALYLDRQPPPKRRWLHQLALRTPAGQQMRPLFFELVASLGALATLGGTWSLKENRVYRPIARLQSMLAAALEARGKRARAHPG